MLSVSNSALLLPLPAELGVPSLAAAGLLTRGVLPRLAAAGRPIFGVTCLCRTVTGAGWGWGGGGGTSLQQAFHKTNTQTVSEHA